jgi:3-mercaptopyruvate sulfurtransferase SseA
MNTPTQRRRQVPLLLILIGGLLLLGAAAWFFFQGGQEQAVPTASQADIPYPEVPRVLLEDAKAAYDSQTAVFVDVRGEQYYQQAHIAGALSMPEDQMPARLGELNPQDWIITYCT